MRAILHHYHFKFKFSPLQNLKKKRTEIDFQTHTNLALDELSKYIVQWLRGKKKIRLRSFPPSAFGVRRCTVVNYPTCRPEKITLVSE